MLKRFAPLVPIALATLLVACINQLPSEQAGPVTTSSPSKFVSFEEEVSRVEQEQLENQLDDEPYEMPELADSLLDLGRSLIGTRYRFGGSTVQTGFDCSGFVAYLFREEVGLDLPRSTRELIKVDAPRVARNDLEPGDLILFNDRGRGRVSHAGIYIGDDQFIHSSSSRSGGVRIDRLDDSYWNRSYMEAKRVLALATPKD